MQKTWPKACVAAALLALSAPAGALAQPVINTPFGEPIDEASIEIDPQSVVKQYAAAFNNRDVELMEALMHPGIQIMDVTAAGTEMVSEGYWAIVSHLLDHIEDPETPTLALSGWSRLDDYVTAIETSRWTSPDGSAHGQKRLTVYQVTGDGTIRRIWYYPPVADE